MDVLLRIATLDGIPPNALNELNEIMERQFAGNQNLKSSNIGGVQCAANILNFMDSGQDQAILGEIARIDAPLSNRIQDLMFVFDDLVDLDDREMQLVLREVSGERLGLALRGADIKVRDKITRNMSQRAAEILLEDMEARGPVRLSDVEGAQRGSWPSSSAWPMKAPSPSVAARRPCCEQRRALACPGPAGPARTGAGAGGCVRTH